MLKPTRAYTCLSDHKNTIQNQQRLTYEQKRKYI